MTSPLAKLLQTSGDLRVADTQAGTMVGTPRYMAPEQAAGLEVDARTDIYALGTILYEMLAGNPPFESMVFGQLAADIITQPPPPLPSRTQAGEPIPKSLQELISSCLSKRAEGRPPSMAAISTWLERALQTPVKSAGPSKGLLIAGVGAVLILSGVGYLVSRPAPVTAPVVLPPAPVVVAPPQPPPVLAPADVTLTIVTTPAKVNVIRLDTNTVVGITPLTLRQPKSEQPLRLRLERWP